MSIRQISYSLEISFWWTIIPWMSKSCILRKTVEFCWKIYQGIQEKPYWQVILICSAASLFGGVLLGFLSAL
ncbi:MAG: hypothetical protein GYA34_10270 [Chloroflexi bacterium]|nr:hypothetical protein [Chloroflexota bacterium]